MKSPFVLKILLVAVPLLCLAPALRADTSLSENFDELTPAPGVTSAGAFHTINGTNVDVVGGLNGSFFPSLCVAPASGNCIDLGGSEGNPVGVLVSNSSFDPGTYDLSFDLLGSQRSETTSATVTFGDYTQTFLLDPFDTTSGVVINELVTVTGSPAYLTFTNDGTNDYGDEGPLLDNVTVTTAVTGATPEPGSLALLGTGALGILATFRRKIFAAR
ncbi:MAG TPA: PEP-CTERM sorting domain-containing protein [Acidobacteriaceae bacterium]|jgi:hypothetical protein|nr:PEP-CTERM sorting domain-containing protein [Acidobacteriaceae bacterium]